MGNFTKKLLNFGKEMLQFACKFVVRSIFDCHISDKKFPKRNPIVKLNF